MDDPARLQRALAAIDAVNAEDPNRLELHGESRPKELVHAELVSGWVEKLTPRPDEVGEALRLAARAHHVRRWAIPRSDYPEGRLGYLRWRYDLQALHAETVGGILRACGYDAASIARVQDLVRKKGLGRDPEVQVLEDALCLTFLETQFLGLAARLGEEKLLEVTGKTLRKMSPAARRWATQLELGAAERTLLKRALES